jgi:hypothetical protein
MIVFQQYNELMICPEMKEKRQYIFYTSDRIDLEDDQYRLFLKGLYKYFSEPINNKKIAKFVGKNIKPNHIRYF